MGSQLLPKENLRLRTQVAWWALRGWDNVAQAQTDRNSWDECGDFVEEGACEQLHRRPSADDPSLTADGGMPFQSGAPQALAAIVTNAALQVSGKHEEDSITRPLLRGA